MKNYLYLMLVVIAGMITSCSETNETDNEYENWKERNEAYFSGLYQKAQAVTDGSWRTIRPWGKNPETKNPADYIVVEVLESGDASAERTLDTDSVQIHYRGRLMPTAAHADGYQFDSSWAGDYNLETMLATKGVANSYIVGFTTALTAMRPGDRWKVYIPYNLGYGSAVQGSIPAYSTLVFDLTLVKSWKRRK